MPGVITTKINFVSTSVFNLVQTGNLLWILALILLITSVGLALFLAYKRKLVIKHNGTKTENSISVIGNNTGIFIACLIAIFLAIVAFTIGINLKANAAPSGSSFVVEGEAATSESINAFVNEETGQITIEDGILKNLNDKYSMTLNKTSLISKEALGDASWSVIMEGNTELYGLSANNEKQNNIEIEINNSRTLNYFVSGLNIDTAKSLIGKTVAEVNFYYTLNIKKLNIEGKVELKQTPEQARLRTISPSGQKVFYTEESGQVYSANVNEDGSYKISEVPENSKGSVFASVVGCKTTDSKGEILKDHKIDIVEPLHETLYDVNLIYEGPDFDYYLLKELKQASEDLSTSDSESAYFNEFNTYIRKDKIWWSNSNNQQPANCTSQDCSAAKPELCNQDYKCNFTNSNGEPIDDIDQFLFLRIIGINHDQYAKTNARAGLTLQAISCLPVTGSYGPADPDDPAKTWVAETSFGKFWGDANCSLRNALTLENGSIYNAFSQSYKENFAEVKKNTERTHKWGSNSQDIVQTKDKVFPLSYTEMRSSGSEYSGFNSYLWYKNSSEGAQYAWYLQNGIKGNESNPVLTQMTKPNSGKNLKYGWNPWTRTVYHKTDHNMLYISSSDQAFYHDNSYENEYSVVVAFCL